MLTNTERESINKALEAATPGPWLYDEPIIWTVEDGEPTDKPQGYWSVIGGQPSGQICIIDELEKRSDAHLIANTPTWLKQQDEMIEQLLAEVKQITEDYGIVKQALENDQEHHRRMIKERLELQAEVIAKDVEIERMQKNHFNLLEASHAIAKSEEQTKAALAIAVEALEWYADKKNHEWGDKGERARQALSQVSKE